MSEQAQGRMGAIRPRPEPADGRAPVVREGPLSLDEERRLAQRWLTSSDERALARLVQAHLGLVIRIAMEFRHSGPPLEDLIQEGNLGLTIAARRFDPDRATRLATYATYWIRACMLEHVVRSHGPVRIGTTRSQRKIFFGLGRARRKIESAGAVADAEHLALALGVEEGDVEAMTPRLTGRDVSLDAPRGFEDRRPVAASLAEEGPTPEDMVAGVEEDDLRRGQLKDGLKILDARERAIIRARHLRQRPATLAALGKRFGISRERVRQLELRAKAKLRVFCEGELLAEAPAPIAQPAPKPKRRRAAPRQTAVVHPELEVEPELGSDLDAELPYAEASLAF